MMKRMKRGVSLCIIVVMLISALSGCAQNAGGKGGIRIFFSLNQMDTFRRTLVDAAAEKAAEVGAQFVMEDAEGSIEKQVELMKSTCRLENMSLSVPANRLPESFRQNMCWENLRAVRRSMWHCSKVLPIIPPLRAGQMV